ncbi:MAG TPA: LLM class F420-dependent oxidoreductase [Ktedonobacteraceae bacterium]|jgi:F420-dependent oxidoreductase-like protein|nr:LLM class F420-dependent oxidoreductase [Ktedonobacteraceae bacterium]
MAVQFGVGIPQGWRMDMVEIADPEEKYEAMTRAAKEADRLGYDSIWLFDHFHTVPTPELETTFECFTSLAGLARDTQHVKLGQMATCNGYRNPALMAKIGSTIDVMSHGRFILGFGAGWYEHEYRAYGYGYPETRERMARFREATEIIHRMWTENYPTFSGKYYSIDKPINEPKGVQKPHPPLWLAGSGEKVTLKLVAQWGDGCNISGSDPVAARHKLEVLRQHCDTFNRNFDELSRSASLNVHLVDSEATAEAETAEARKGQDFAQYASNIKVRTAKQCIADLEELMEVGFNYFIFYPPRTAYDLTQMQRLASEVLPHFRQS